MGESIKSPGHAQRRETGAGESNDYFADFD